MSSSARSSAAWGSASSRLPIFCASVANACAACFESLFQRPTVQCGGLRQTIRPFQQIAEIQRGVGATTSERTAIQSLGLVDAALPLQENGEVVRGVEMAFTERLTVQGFGFLDAAERTQQKREVVRGVRISRVRQGRQAISAAWGARSWAFLAMTHRSASASVWASAASQAVGDPPQFLDIDVDQLAGAEAFVAADDPSGGPVQPG